MLLLLVMREVLRGEIGSVMRKVSESLCRSPRGFESIKREAVKKGIIVSLTGVVFYWFQRIVKMAIK